MLPNSVKPSSVLKRRSCLFLVVAFLSSFIGFGAFFIRTQNLWLPAGVMLLAFAAFYLSFRSGWRLLGEYRDLASRELS